MKKLLLALTVITALLSCETADKVSFQDGFKVVIIQDCEYIKCPVYGGYNLTHMPNCSNHHRYTLVQGDSPRVSGYHPEVDLISNDSIHVNWYSNAIEPFYDGEGNVIPYRAVKLLVDAQFVKMTSAEEDTIKKHFYFYKYKSATLNVKMPPLEKRCTEYNKNGSWCRNWSRTDSEYCWNH